MNSLLAIWRFRGLARAITERELRTRYTGSSLGPLWLVLQPLAMVLVYTLVFSQLMRARLPGIDSSFAYSVYLLTGVISWNLFLEIIQKSKNLFVEHGNLIKKVSFPRLVLYVPVVAVAGFNFLIMTILFLIFTLLVGMFPGKLILAAIPSLVLLTLMAVAMGVLLSSLQVFFRDIGQVIDILLQLLFWATPIVYPSSILPAAILRAIQWNPLVPLFSSLQTIFLEHRLPDFSTLWYPAAVTVVFGLLATYAYRRLYGAILDEL
ncbi:ABC transporter permease [Pigmentiphaga aceris]|uniref:Transport permease protein n=1 Tax=Pigmentiphaga aceris TaxID=1940612 RepID=A0A5C0B5M2_9BURK|nr:ABC transporter permease [Pigmentiphaga aceris]QEI08620.1 ABC transporter permease [Pigmentiphaga aceris]